MASSTFIPDLIVYLSGGLSLVYGTNLFKGPLAKMPDGDGPFVSIIRTGGLGAEATHNSPDAPAYERPTAQIVSRAVAYDVAENMAYQVYDLLWPVQDQVINGTYWRVLNVRSEPFDLPPDEKGLARLAFNIDCVKRVSPATS